MSPATHREKATDAAGIVRVVVGHSKKDKKLAKMLAHALHERTGFEIALARSGGKSVDADDEHLRSIAEADLFVALSTQSTRGASGVHQHTEHAHACSVPVLIVARVEPPERLAASAHVLRIGKKSSEIGRQLSDLDVDDLLGRKRANPASRVDSAAPSARVVAIVHRSHAGDDGILLMRRGHGPAEHRWCLPGGDVARYEPCQEAVRRVVRESTGLDFEASFLSYFDEILPRDDSHRVNLAFVGPGSGEVEVDTDAIDEVAWRPVLDALTLDLAPTDRDVLQAFAEGV